MEELVALLSLELGHVDCQGSSEAVGELQRLDRSA